MKTTTKPGLAGPDGKMIKAPVAETPALTFSATVTLDPGSSTSPGKLRVKPGADKAYQPIIVALGDGIVLRGQVYVPCKLLAAAAVERAKANWQRAQEEAGDDAKPAKRFAAGSIG